jgi:hypothetical protein
MDISGRSKYQMNATNINVVIAERDAKVVQRAEVGLAPEDLGTLFAMLRTAFDTSDIDDGQKLQARTELDRLQAESEDPEAKPGALKTGFGVLRSLAEGSGALLALVMNVQAIADRLPHFA